MQHRILASSTQALNPESDPPSIELLYSTHTTRAYDPNNDSHFEKEKSIKGVDGLNKQHNDQKAKIRVHYTNQTTCL